LNAIQRKYPQIYKTTDRLQVQPGSVRVQPKDFMLAVKSEFVLRRRTDSRNRALIGTIDFLCGYPAAEPARSAAFK
jgi:hypothetical protein